MIKRLFTVAAMAAGSIALFAETYSMASPDGKLVITINTDKHVTWSVSYNRKAVVADSRLALNIDGMKTPLCDNAKVVSYTTRHIHNTQHAVVPCKQRDIDDNYLEATLKFKGGYSLEFRAYNNGAAYRFVTNNNLKVQSNKVRVIDETVELNFPEGTTAYWPYDKYKQIDYQTCYEVAFHPNMPLDSVKADMLGVLPIYFSTPDGLKAVVTETNLVDYPNLFLSCSNSETVSGKFPPVFLKTELKQGSDRGLNIVETAPYIAETDKVRSYPWRLLLVNSNDCGVLENNLAYQVASPSTIIDTSWIKPGKISWDWWSMLNIYGVDFEAGVNTPTYKYIIDFAARYGFEYILLDEGWSKSTWNIKEYKPEVDVEELVKYAAERGVGVVLWALWNPLDLDVDGILDVYEKWGVKGIKIDFMDRSDQDMVNFYERVAKSAADHKLLVDFHGAYKPAGLQKRYPNVMTFEGVLGMEHDKDSRDISPSHNLMLPFTRMVAGPMDYTPGAVRNATADDFAINFWHPMSQGTRAQQVALFVVFESPLQMVADSPSHFNTAPEYASFLAKIPTVWDETKALNAQIGELAVVARRSGDKWYLGALTDWTPRNIDANLSFLTSGKKYKMEIFCDGANAHREATDYKISERVVSADDTTTIKMAPGGGYVAIFTPIN